MNLTKIAARGAAAVVAGVAGFASYRHITHVALLAGESEPVAYALPLAIDGLIVVGTMAMLEDKRSNRIPRASARFALGFGVVATLAANVASAQPTWLARAVAAVPAVAFLIAVEVLSRSGKLRETPAPAPAESHSETAQVEPAQTAPETPKAAPAPKAKPAAKPRAQKSTPVRRPASETRALVEAALSADPAPTKTEVAKDLGVSVRRIHEVMSSEEPVAA